MKQSARVLRALRRHPDGVCQADFLPPNVIDGGRPIARLAARVLDLRREGHEILTDGERFGYALYRFPRAKPAPLPPPVVEMPERPASPPTLFDEAA